MRSYLHTSVHRFLLCYVQRSQRKEAFGRLRYTFFWASTKWLLSTRQIRPHTTLMRLMLKSATCIRSTSMNVRERTTYIALLKLLKHPLSDTLSILWQSSSCSASTSFWSEKIRGWSASASSSLETWQPRNFPSKAKPVATLTISSDFISWLCLWLVCDCLHMSLCQLGDEMHNSLWCELSRPDATATLLQVQLTAANLCILQTYVCCSTENSFSVLYIIFVSMLPTFLLAVPLSLPFGHPGFLPNLRNLLRLSKHTATNSSNGAHNGGNSRHSWVINVRCTM